MDGGKFTAVTEILNLEECDSRSQLEKKRAQMQDADGALATIK